MTAGWVAVPPLGLGAARPPPVPGARAEGGGGWPWRGASLGGGEGEGAPTVGSKGGEKDYGNDFVLMKDGYRFHYLRVAGF